MSLPRTVLVCTTCWERAELTPNGDFKHATTYTCKACGAAYTNPKKQCLEIFQITPKHGKTAGLFLAQNRLACPGCAQTVQFQATELRDNKFHCPLCKYEADRSSLGIYQVTDLTEQPVNNHCI